MREKSITGKWITPIGYCNCELHTGALDKNLVKKHKCIQKKCKHLEKYSEDAFRLNKYNNRSKK